MRNYTYLYIFILVNIFTLITACKKKEKESFYDILTNGTWYLSYEQYVNTGANSQCFNENDSFSFDKNGKFSSAYFGNGTYTFDETTKSITLNIQQNINPSREYNQWYGTVHQVTETYVRLTVNADNPNVPNYKRTYILTLDRNHRGCYKR